MPVALPRAPPDSYVGHGEALKASKREADPKMSAPAGIARFGLRPHVDDVVDRADVDTG